MKLQGQNFFWVLCFVFCSIVCNGEETFSNLAQSLQEVAKISQPPKTAEIVDTSISLSDKNLIEVYTDIRNFIEKQQEGGTYQQNYLTAPKFTADILIATAAAFSERMNERLHQTAWLPGGTEGYLFVRKLILPAGSEVEFRGDLHGDVASLIRWLDGLRDAGWIDKHNPFKLLHSDHYLAFLGDYADRGHYGAEVMFIIMQLFLHNPDNVLIVRGNHEDFKTVMRYGFFGGLFINNTSSSELIEKFGKDFTYTYDGGLFLLEEGLQAVVDVYNYMPVALFLGCVNVKGNGVDFIQCCHGGMEPGYDSRELLETKEKDIYQWLPKTLDKHEMKKMVCSVTPDLKDLLTKSCLCQESCDVNGFQWNDFDFMNSDPLGLVQPNKRGSLDFHQHYTTQLLRNATAQNSTNRVWAVFRAHQHNSETVPHILQYGNGLYKLWHGSEDPLAAIKKGFSWIPQWSGKNGEAVSFEPYSVWTFNVAPRTGSYETLDLENFTYDTVARLELESGFKNWKLYPRKIVSLT